LFRPDDNIWGVWPVVRLRFVSKLGDVICGGCCRMGECEEEALAFPLSIEFGCVEVMIVNRARSQHLTENICNSERQKVSGFKLQ
jgi:hypothetical protein